MTGCASCLCVVGDKNCKKKKSHIFLFGMIVMVADRFTDSSIVRHLATTKLGAIHLLRIRTNSRIIDPPTHAVRTNYDVTMITIHRRTHYFVCQMVKYQHELEQKYSDWFDEQKCVIYASKISEEYKNSEPWCSTEIIRTRLYLRNYFLLLPESQQFSR